MYKHVCADCFWYIMMLFLNHIQGHRVFRFNWGHKGSLSPQFSVVPNRHRIVSPCFHSNARNQLVLSRTYLVLVDFAWSHNQIAQQSAVCCFVFSQLFSAAPRCLCASPCVADSRLLVPRRPFLPALSAQQTCCCCCGCPDILQPLCSSSAAAQILVPCSAAAQMLCLPCFCCCLHPDTLRCPTLLHLIYPTGNSFLSSDTQSQLYRKSGDGVLNSSSEGGWVGGGLKFSFSAMQIKRKWHRYQLRRNI